jgi:hypothetical protein
LFRIVDLEMLDRLLDRGLGVRCARHDRQPWLATYRSRSIPPHDQSLW